MASPNVPDPIERLLAERAWVRRLARSLVADADAADDLTQQTYVTALQRPPEGLRSPRAWLGTVVRNLAGNRRREAGRRDARERVVGRPGPQESTSDAVARAETVERVAALVLALDEPYRTTVLLRYFEDKPPRRIAAQLGVPVETVRTRLKRALQRLRHQLDDAHQGDRRAWLGALLPVAELGHRSIAVSTAAWGGALLVNQTTRIAVVLLLLAAFGVAAWRVLPDAGTVDIDESAARAAPGARAEPEALVPDRTAATLIGAHPERAAAPEEGARIAFFFRGRVFRPGRFPAADVAVEARLDGTHFATARTDADGKYRIPIPVGALDHPTTGLIMARDETGHAALDTRYVLPTRDEDVWFGALVLRETHPLDVRVIRAGKGVVQARVQLSAEGWMMQGVLLTAETDAHGHLRIPDLPSRVYRLSATTPGAGHDARFVRVPDASQEVVTLSLGAPRTLAVRVVAGPEARPVVGIQLAVSERVRRSGNASSGYSYQPRLSIPRTDEDGWTQIDGLRQGESIALVVLTPTWRGPRGIPTPTGDGWRERIEVGPDEDTVTIALPEKRTLSWPLVDGEVPAPANGTEVAIATTPREFRRWAPSTGIVRDGNLVVSGLLPGAIALRALAPDGTRALLVAVAGTDVGETTAFLRPRKLAVQGRTPDGQPLAGYRARLGRRPNTELVLDGDGRGTWEGLWPARALRLQVREPGTAHTPFTQIGTVDIQEGDASFDFVRTPAPEHELLLRVRTGDRARLPDAYRLRLDPGKILETKEDPDAGTIKVRWRMEDEHGHCRLFLEARGWLPWQSKIRPEPRSLDIHLDAGAEVALRVRPPADGRYGAVLRRLDAQTGTWVPSGGHRFGDRMSATPDLDVAILQGLRAGTYKVQDRLSGRETEAIDLVAGKPATLDLDLSQVVAISGKVKAPEGTKLSLARIRQGATPMADAPVAAYVQADGSFGLRAVEGALLQLHVWHPVLPAAPEGGSVTCRVPCPDLTLTLAGTATVVWTFAPGERSVWPPRRFRFLLFAENAVGRPDHVLHATVEAKGEVLEATLGAMPAGRWSIWVDPGFYAPVLLLNRRLAEPPPKPIPLSLGGGLHVKVLLPKGAEEPMVTVRATRDASDFPAYERLLSEMGREQTLRGLGPGRFRVTVTVIRDLSDDGAPPVLDETIRVYGGEIVERVIDLR